MKDEKLAQVQDLWERGIEQASENSQHESEVGTPTLNTVAGLQVKSGVQSGGSSWCSGGATMKVDCP